LVAVTGGSRSTRPRAAPGSRWRRRRRDRRRSPRRRPALRWPPTTSTPLMPRWSPGVWTSTPRCRAWATRSRRCSGSGIRPATPWWSSSSA